MQFSFRYSKILTVLFLLSSSFSGFAQTLEADSSCAIINIYRPKSFLGSGSKLTLKLNGVEVGNLKNGTKMSCKIYSEGVIRVEVASKRPYASNTCPIEIEHNKEYNLKVFWPYASTVRVVPETKQEAVEKLRKDENYRPGIVAEMIEEDKNNPIPINQSTLPEKESGVKKESKDPVTSGSGIGISDQGHLITNYHVIKDSEFIYVKGVNGDFNTKYKVQVVVKDELNDLAILKINDENFGGWKDTIPYSIKTSLAEVGENIFVLGYPLTTTMGDEIKLTNGIVSSKTGFKGNISLYQISAPVQPGNSGGPLFDSNGNLIGVITAKHLEAENVSYAIKSNYLTNLVSVMPEPISLPKQNSLSGLSLPEQVKRVKKFIVLIEVH